MSRAIGFDAACARCHESSLAVQASEGFDLLALPSLTSASAERVTAWPVTATRFYDRKVTPLADLLLRSEDSVGVTFEAIPDRDYGRIDPEDRRLVAAAERVAEAHRRLLEEIGIRGQLVWLDHASKVGLKRSTVLSLTRSISPQLIQEATRRWFEESADTPVRGLESTEAISDQEGGSALGDELLGDELLGDELLGDE
ncbi:MAG: hypothetical protein GY904_26775, partial [Planctomycetaceae bacterium]|nr:hypothetical protein [Planctomycetaceae bacterium]